MASATGAARLRMSLSLAPKLKLALITCLCSKTTSANLSAVEQASAAEADVSAQLRSSVILSRAAAATAHHPLICKRITNTYKLTIS